MSLFNGRRARTEPSTATTATTGPPERPVGPDTTGHLVTLIGKPGCHLCDEARKVVEEVAAEFGASVEERDITQDDELRRTYWEQIPVVLIDGAQHDFWRVSADRLRAALGAAGG